MGEEVSIMTDNLILHTAQKSRRCTQKQIADMLGVHISSINRSMNRPRMSLEMFSKILDALDYDVVIADRETGNVMWKLEVERPEAYLDDDI